MSETTSASGASARRQWLARHIPIAQWLPRYDAGKFTGDLTAGVIVAVMLVPQGMAYAMLAGLPPQVGLYASVVPLVIYGMLGTSRSLAVGPVAILSLMTATSVGSLAAEGSSPYVALALLLAFLAGVVQLLLGLLRAGFLVNFLSHPVLSGFINAAALLIAASQARHLLGIDAGRGETFYAIARSLVGSVGSASMATMILGAGAIATLVYFKTWFAGHLARAGVPWATAVGVSRTGPLLVVVLATLGVWLFDLQREGVRVVGTVPAALPPLSLPSFDPGAIRALLPAALVISLIGFAESISVAKALASRRRERVDADKELIALGAANLGASFSGGYPVTGGLSRSAVNDAAGARTGMASVITAAIVLLTLLFLTSLLTYLPHAALAAIVVVAVSSLFEVRTLRRAWIVQRADAGVLLLTFVTVLTLGIEAGLLTGVVISLVLHLWRTSSPHVAELGQIGESEIYRNVRRHPARTFPDTVLLRIDESLYFANARVLEETVRAAIARRNEVRHVILVGSAVNDIDSSALETLEALFLELRSKEIDLHLAAFKGPILDRLRHTSLMQMVGPSRTHLTTHDAMYAIGADR